MIDSNSDQWDWLSSNSNNTVDFTGYIPYDAGTFDFDEWQRELKQLSCPSDCPMKREDNCLATKCIGEYPEVDATT